MPRSSMRPRTARSSSRNADSPFGTCRSERRWRFRLNRTFEASRGDPTRPQTFFARWAWIPRPASAISTQADGESSRRSWLPDSWSNTRLRKPSTSSWRIDTGSNLTRCTPTTSRRTSTAATASDGMAVCLGDREALSRAEKLLDEYTSKVLGYLVSLESKGLFPKKHIQFFYCDD